MLRRDLGIEFDEESKQICLAWKNDPQERDLEYFIETMASPEYKKFIAELNDLLDEQESKLIAAG